MHSSNQLTIDFTPGLTERHPTWLACIRECAYTHKNPLKTIAGDMDMSGSTLSRKLSDKEEGEEEKKDVRRLSVDELVKFVEVTGDTRPVYWLVEKFLQDNELKKKRAMSQLTALMPDILALFKQASEAA